MTFTTTAIRMACSAALLLAATTAGAASHSGYEARYQKDRQACMSGNTNEARDVCLREAGAARDEAAKGDLNNKPGTNTAGNAVQRCDVFTKPVEHAECLDRMRGQGNTTGSAMQGGVLHESVTTTTVPATAK